MNTFASFIPQRKTNNLIGWLNKPSLQQLGANLAPLQKFVKRTAKGSHFYFGTHRESDDQTVDTMSTWEDHQHRISDRPPRLRQTMVIVSPGPPLTSITAKKSELPVACESTMAMERHQRKSQQKNKVLMLLQLEQVATMRAALRERRQVLKQDLVQASIQRRKTKRIRSRLQRLRELDERIQAKQRQSSIETYLLDLSEFYRKFDACIEELHDRNEIMELEAFKQLVIREVEERAEALQKFRERLKIVHGQLMQKFIVDELIEGGLYTEPMQKKRHRETLNDWVQVGEGINGQRNPAPANSAERSEWVFCDFVEV